jgi:cell wall assembly regulator SMI1
LIFFLFLNACEGQFQADNAALLAAKDAYDPQLLRASLVEIEAWHVENKTGVAETLKDGLSVSAIAGKLEGTDCKPTEEMKALWSWHNGTTAGPAPFVWYHDFLSLDEAVSEYRWLTLNPLIPWDPNYIPLFSDEGEWYAGYCGKGSNTAGPIINFFLEEGATITYINITTFLASMAEAMRTGAVSWEDGAMTDDIHEVLRIHQKYNQGYQFPYYVPDND